MKTNRIWWPTIFVVALLTFIAESARSQEAALSLDDLSNVVITRDVDYVTEADYDEDRDKLDIYMPKGSSSVPVIVFFHAGGLLDGDKSDGAFMAKRFVPEGMGVVSANYRLSPRVMHPAHIRDSAAAFAWVVKNIGRYGGDPGRVYVSGHSAGAYLATLMSLDPAYLEAQGLKLDAIRGTIAISPFLYVEESAKARPKSIWGEDPEVWREASVSPHIRQDTRPLLLIYADGDDEWRRSQIETFGKAMAAAGNVGVRVEEVPNRDHSSLLYDLNAADDRIQKLVLEFIHNGT